MLESNHQPRPSVILDMIEKKRLPSRKEKRSVKEQITNVIRRIQHKSKRKYGKTRSICLLSSAYFVIRTTFVNFVA